jgi:hypothetical protein
MLVVGAAFIGLGVFKAGEDLGDCLLGTLHAQGLPDLDRAADYLAQAVVILGITTFFALLAKMAGKFARGGGAAEKKPRELPLPLKIQPRKLHPPRNQHQARKT